MPKLNRITLEDTEKIHHVEDMSFRFPNTGFVSIHGDDESLMLQLIRLLVGLYKPCNDSMVYREEVMEYFTLQEQCRYRGICTALLFRDFQLLEQRSILDNIRTSYDEDEQKLDNLLRQQGLYGKKGTWIEDLDSDDRTRMMLPRIPSRHPRVLVIYPPSSPSSTRERGRMLPLLKKLSTGLLVMIAQGENSYPWSDRIIKFEAGHIIPSSHGQGSTHSQQPVSKTQLQLQPRIMKRTQTQLHHRPHLKYLLLILLILTSLILAPIAVFSITLDVTEVEMLYLKQNDLTSIAVKKHATGSGGETHEKRYVSMQDADVQTLEEELKGDVLAGYVPVDSNIIVKSSYLTSADNYTIIEIDTVERTGLKKIYGHYPDNIYETAITYQTALNLFSFQYGVQSPEFHLYQAVSWYGFPLIVTEIIAEDQSNSNLSLSTGGYAGNTTGPSSLNSGLLYVYPGFHEEYSSQQQQTFASSSKCFIDKLTLRPYEIGNLYPIPYANACYFYDGEQLHLDNDGKSQSIAREGEVLLDFPTVLHPRYHSRYLEGHRDDALLSRDMREADYTSSVKNWIGKTIEMQAYATDTAPDDNTLMKKTVKIKGSLFPITWDYAEDYLKSEGSILMSKEAVADYMQPNTMMQSVCFRPEKETNMRGALQYLRQYPTYSTFFSRSRLLQPFVVGLKKMSFLLFTSGGAATLLSIAPLMHLLQSIMEDDRRKMSIYCVFGENMYILKGYYVQHILALVRRHTVTGCLMVTLVVSVFVLMICMKPSAAVTILLPPFLSLLVSADHLLLLTLITHQLMKRTYIVEKLLCDEKNGNI